MKKNLLFIFIMLFSIINIQAQENKSKEYFVTATKLNVRENSSANSEVLYQLKKGDKVFVINIENGWAEIEVEISGIYNGFISEKFISTNATISETNESKIGVFDDLLSEENQIYLFLLLGFLLLNYIIALVKSHKGTIVAISNWFDLFLLLVPILGFFALMFFTQENNQEHNNKVFLYYGIISGIAMLGTLIFSIISNRDNFINIFISFFSKLFVMLISIIMIFVIFGGSNSKKDGRYSDGTKGNSHTKWKIILASIAGYLIFSLVSNKKKGVISAIGEQIYTKG